MKVKKLLELYKRDSVISKFEVDGKAITAEELQNYFDFKRILNRDIHSVRVLGGDLVVTTEYAAYWKENE